MWEDRTKVMITLIPNAQTYMRDLKYLYEAIDESLRKE